MKKLFLLSVVLTAAMAVSAQMKIAPKMEKGLVKEYNTAVNTKIPGQKEANISSVTKYTVTETTADGYVVDVMATTFKSDATPDNIAGQLLSGVAEMLKGLNVRVGTNKDGKAERIVNYAELKQQLDGVADKVVENMYKAVPQLSQMVPQATMKKQLMDGVTEEKLLKTIQSAASVMALNGKTVMTGAQEEFVNEQEMKMKRMYFVNGKNVVTNSSANLSNDELKAFIIAQVEKAAPEQAEMVKQNIDQLISAGVLKLDVKDTATYEFQEDGWAKAVTVDSSMDMIGQSTNSHTVITAK